MATVQLSGINKSFAELQVIHDINLDIASREFVVIVGPSGCGKSTLLRIIAGLEDVSAGRISIDGRDVTGLEPVDRGIAMVFQSYALYPHMTVAENMTFGLRVAGVPKAEIARRLQAAAHSLQLTPYLDRRPAQLSGGQRQRVAIGRSIVRDPKVFLFDEPLSNLDAELRVHMRLELARLHKSLGATMVYVTHDQIEAMTLADKIVVLQEGRIEQLGPPLELFDDPANLFVAGFIGSPRMNFLRARVLACAPLRLAIDGDPTMAFDVPHLRTSLPVAEDVTIGLRPQHLRIAQDGPLRLRADVVEQLGDVGYVYGTTPAGSPLVAQIGDRLSRVPDCELRLQFNPEAAFVFGDAGQRLR
jgi:lactose/L-arabinose transport system ATP-binding protein